MNVVFMEGMLYLQGVKFGKKTWRKMWMVLFKPSSSGVGRMELYTVPDSNAVIDQKKACKLKTTERKVVRLSDCLSITPAPRESCPRGCTAFYLNTTQCTYTLASMTSQDWLSALCLLAFQKDPGATDKAGSERGNDLTMEDNDLYSPWKTDVKLPPNHYQVTVMGTEASRRCKLAGDYLISPDSGAVLLLTVKTGHTIYTWPYTHLRKFGQIEGGFSIEAGRRCASGEGVFIFLSQDGPQIFQAISQQCSMRNKPNVQHFSGLRRSFSDQNIDLCNTPNQATAPPDRAAADEESDIHYATIEDVLAFNAKPTSLTHNYFTKEAAGEGSEDQYERCHSLDALNPDYVVDEVIYCNLRRAEPPVTKMFAPEINDSECIYSDVQIVSPPLNLQLLPYSPPLLPPVPQPDPCTPLQSVPNPLPRTVYQRQPPASNYTQPGYNAQAQPADDMKEMEEAISPLQVNPTEPPGSFKYRLAEIISKDLAKFQPPLPSGLGTPPFSQ